MESRRSISEAIYQKHNPLGDPFSFNRPKNLQEGILFGMGLGLYWGEGAKRGKGGVRLTNSDPKMIRKFIEFLESIFGVERKSLRFSLQIFGDISPRKAMRHWRSSLGAERGQFYKTIVSKVRGKGTYKYKSEFGVAIVYFNNTRLKSALCEMIENIHQV